MYSSEVARKILKTLKNGTVTQFKHLSNNYDNTDMRTKALIESFVTLKTLW